MSESILKKLNPELGLVKWLKYISALRWAVRACLGLMVVYILVSELSEFLHVDYGTIISGKDGEPQNIISWFVVITAYILLISMVSYLIATVVLKQRVLNKSRDIYLYLNRRGQNGVAKVLEFNTLTTFGLRGAIHRYALEINGSKTIAFERTPHFWESISAKMPFIGDTVAILYDPTDLSIVAMIKPYQIS